MARNIAFFADGTWNGPDKDENDDGIPDPTNVFRLFKNRTLPAGARLHPSVALRRRARNDYAPVSVVAFLASGGMLA